MERMGKKPNLFVAAALGAALGTGLAIGFLIGRELSPALARLNPPAAASAAPEIPGPGFQGDGQPGSGLNEPSSGESPDTGLIMTRQTRDIGLTLENSWMDADENGLFIAGVIKNSRGNSFDAIRVTFDLLDPKGMAYSAVTGKNDEPVGPGESWDFTIYIPFSEMDKFSSYRLQSLIGAKRK
jgi:hypothetical protein